MFGKAGLGGLMKQAQQMQENMKKRKPNLPETEIERRSRQRPGQNHTDLRARSTENRYQPRLIQEAADDKEMLEDLILGAIRNFARKAKKPQTKHAYSRVYPEATSSMILTVIPRRRKRT